MLIDPLGSSKVITLCSDFTSLPKPPGLRFRFDLKKAFDEYITKTGHFIIYIRTNRAIFCKCYNEKTRTSTLDCLECLGENYPVQLEKILVRRRAFSSSSSRDVTVPIPDGYMYYLSADVHPQIGDDILEVEWDKFGRPVSIIRDMEIKFGDDLRDYGGKLAFWQCPATPKVVNKEKKERMLRKIFGV